MEQPVVLYFDADSDRRSRLLEELAPDAVERVHTVDSLDDVIARLEDGPMRYSSVIIAGRDADALPPRLIDLVEGEDVDVPLIAFTEADVQEEGGYPYRQLTVHYVNYDEYGTQRFLSIPHLIHVAVAGGLEEEHRLPPDEEERLAVLAEYDMVDLKTSDVFDRLAQIAALVFDVPIAFIGLIDADTEHFIGVKGFTVRELAREKTACTYTIQGDDVLTVHDPAEDPRFALNEDMEANNIKTYIGLPLKNMDGVTIGTFCLEDTTYRELTEREEEILKLLAEEAVEQLELRRRIT